VTGSSNTRQKIFLSFTFSPCELCGVPFLYVLSPFGFIYETGMLRPAFRQLLRW